MPEYEIVEMYEHEWNRLKRENAEIKQFVQQLELSSPLNARDALSGGRTNAFILHYQVKDDEEMDYIDMIR